MTSRADPRRGDVRRRGQTSDESRANQRESRANQREPKEEGRTTSWFCLIPRGERGSLKARPLTLGNALPMVMIRALRLCMYRDPEDGAMCDAILQDDEQRYCRTHEVSHASR